VSEYVATAAAEKRLREVLGDLATDDLVKALCENVQVEYKPRLKAVVLTVPIPNGSTPVTKTGSTVLVEEDGACPRCGGEGCPACIATPDPTPDGNSADPAASYAPILDTTWQPRPVDADKMWDGDPIE